MAERPSIGIWAGSSPLKPGLLELGLAHARASGFSVIVPPETKKWAARRESRERPYLAGPDEAKVRAFIRLWRDPAVRHIWGTRGGYGTLRLLARLDRENLERYEAKPLWGFSDYTCLQNYLHQRTGAPWVHAPHVTSESVRKPSAIEARAWSALDRKKEMTHVLRPLNIVRNGLPRVGTLVGGNLTCFVSLFGTPWQPRPKRPFLLFLEDLNEAPYRLDRLLQQIAHSGMLSRCRGVVLGHFSDCGDWRGTFTAWAREQKIALYAGVRAGHHHPNLPLVMGKSTRIESSKLVVPTLSLRT